MNKREIEDELNSITLEKRALLDKIKDETIKVDVEECRKKIADLKSKEAKLIKDLCEFDRPVEADVSTKASFRSIAEGMQKRSFVSLNGAGGVLTVKELVKKVTEKTDILDRAKYFYGPNSSTNIPVWSSHVSMAFVNEGSTAAAQDKTLGATTITPKQAMTSLPVSQVALSLNAAEFENELPDLFAVGMADLMAKGMLQGVSHTEGSDTVVDMTGIFSCENLTKLSKAITIENLANLALTVQGKNYIEPVIVMNSSVYTAFLADTSKDETTKLYKEQLIRDKTIEGVPVVLSPYAPATMEAGDVIAVAGDLSNYAIGVAGEMLIKPKETASSSVTTFDCYSFFSGKPVIESDFIGLVVAE